jgi:hypothetical protein
MKDEEDVKLILKIDKSDWDTFVYFLRDFLKSWGWSIKSITIYEGKKRKTARIWINFAGWEEDNEEKK